MSDFLTPLVYENLDGRKLRIAKGFTYRVGSEDSSEVIRVPEGFVCDGQSYPRLLWFIDNPQGRGAKAGVVHDYLYWLNGRQPSPLAKTYNRAESDAIFKEALEVSGVNWLSRNVRYAALRMFGWAAWNAHSNRIRKELKLEELKRAVFPAGKV